VNNSVRDGCINKVVIKTGCEWLQVESSKLQDHRQ